MPRSQAAANWSPRARSRWASSTLSEIPKGVTVAGPLPGPLQGYTFYEAAVLLKGSRDKACAALVKYLASAPAAAHWEAAKLEPATTYMPTRASRESPAHAPPTRENG